MTPYRAAVLPLQLVDADLQRLACVATVLSTGSVRQPTSRGCAESKQTPAFAEAVESSAQLAEDDRNEIDWTRNDLLRHACHMAWLGGLHVFAAHASQKWVVDQGSVRQVIEAARWPFFMDAAERVDISSFRSDLSRASFQGAESAQ